MSRTLPLFFTLLCWFGVPERADAGVKHEAQDPQLVFAAQELSFALKEMRQEELQVTLAIEPDEVSPEAFRIQRVNPNQIIVIGTDANGAMYSFAIR